MTGYVRQSAGLIISGATILASHSEDEFAAIATAFGASGHDHSGSSGNGPTLGASAFSNGSITYAKIQDVAANNVLLGNDDGAGSTVQELTATEVKTLLSLTVGTDVQAYDAGLNDIAGLAVTDGNIIVGDGANWVAESGATARTSLGLTIGTDVQAYNADTLFADTADNLTAGFTATSYNAGTKSSGTFTPDPDNGNLQYAVNGGAHTLAPPSSTCAMNIQYTNNVSAGTITTSGFDKVDGAFTSTNGDDFFAYITVNNGFSHLNIVALQ